ncbi:MAG: hypothetical protein ABI822_14605 [Bryobacteraceae bacterium]
MNAFSFTFPFFRITGSFTGLAGFSTSSGAPEFAQRPLLWLLTG